MPDDLPPTTPRATSDPLPGDAPPTPTLPPPSDSATAFFEPGDAPTVTPADPHRTNPSGEVRPAPRLLLPGYEVIGQLGAGGMGVVYHARDLRLGREVAVKMILGDRPDPQGLVRFQVEAQAVAAVRHPNVVQVFESGEYDGRPYMVLEFCPGGSLADRLRGGAKFPPREAAELFRRIADGVAAVHAVGIVHRDLKPANILFGGEDGGPTPKVADFGLARRGTGAGLTQSLALMGTPQYMSPEQAEQRTRFVGPAADVWALGVILYECMTGTRPFHADTAEDVLSRVLADRPAPLRPQVDDLPRDLDVIVGKCLEKDQADRYPSAAELAADLGRFVTGDSISARPAGRVERAAKWVRRKPTAAAAWGFSALAVVLALVVGVVASFWREAETARVTAVDARDRLDDEQKETKAAKTTAETALAGKVRAEAHIRRTDYAGRVVRAHQLWLAGDLPRARAALAGCPDDLRGWEWRYVDQLCNPDEVALRGHTGAVNGLSFRPGGTEVATGGDDKTVRVWDVKTGKELRVIPCPDPVRDVAYSPDGKVLAVATGSRVRLLNADDGVEKFMLAGHTKPVSRVCFEPEGKRLATGSEDGTLRYWAPATGAAQRTIDLPKSTPILDLTYSPKLGFVASAADGVIRAWDGNGKVVELVKGPSGMVTHLPLALWRDTQLYTAATPELFATHEVGYFHSTTLFFYDGITPTHSPVLRAASADNAIKALHRVIPAVTVDHHASSIAFAVSNRIHPDNTDPRAEGDSLVHAASVEAMIEDDHPYTFQTNFPGRVRRLAYSPDGSRLGCAGSTGQVRIWEGTDRAAGTHFSSFDVMTGVFSPDGDRFVAITDSPGGVYVYRPDSRDLHVAFREATFQVVVSPSGKSVLLAQEDGAARVYELGSARTLTTLKGHRGAARSAVFSPDGRYVASQDSEGTVRLWSLPAGDVVRAHPGTPRGCDNGVCFRPDGMRYAAVRGDAGLAVWDTGTGALLWETDVGGPLNHIGATPDGRMVIARASDGVFAWNWDGRKAYEIRPADAKLTSHALSRDGRLLATATRSMVELWDAQTGRRGVACKGHDEDEYELAFLPDGSRLVGGGPARRRGCLWDTVTGQVTLEFPSTSLLLRAVVVSPDGGSIAFAGDTTLWIRSARQRSGAVQP